MLSICNDLKALNLTPNQCDELLESVTKILKGKPFLADKKTNNDINWLIQTYHIDKEFYCLKHAIKTNTHQCFYNHKTYFSIEFPTRHTIDGWETTLNIIFENENIVNVIYETDRYAKYDYNERHDMPFGSFQGTCIKEFYKDVTKLHCILSDIDEIKELCSYLFK